MLLTYSHEQFPSLIKAGVKIHTIREDKHNRWRPGMKIHHWMHNPRHPHLHPYPFCENKHHCVSVQKVTIVSEQTKEPNRIRVVIDGRFLSDTEVEGLAKNDGLTNAKVLQTWFFPPGSKKKWWRGKIIHWTDIKY